MQSFVVGNNDDFGGSEGALNNFSFSFEFRTKFI
jgi:hypothetical protein